MHLSIDYTVFKKVQLLIFVHLPNSFSHFTNQIAAQHFGVVLKKFISVDTDTCLYLFQD